MKKFMILALGWAVLLATPTFAAPVISNGDFSQPIPAFASTIGEWEDYSLTASGQSTLSISSTPLVLPQPPMNHVLISTGAPDNYSHFDEDQLASIMCVNATQFETTLGAQYQTGAAIMQVVAGGHAGDQIAFDYNFLTNDTTGGSVAFAFLNNDMQGGDFSAVYLLSTNSGLSGLPGVEGYLESSGAMAGLFTLPEDGTYQLGFGVFQTGGSSNGVEFGMAGFVSGDEVSTLAVSNVRAVGAVPEIDPGSAALPLALGIVLLLMLSDKRRRMP